MQSSGGFCINFYAAVLLPPLVRSSANRLSYGEIVLLQYLTVRSVDEGNQMQPSGDLQIFDGAAVWLSALAWAITQSDRAVG